MCFRRGDYLVAVEAYQGCLAENPEDAKALSNLAEAHLRLQNFAAAWLAARKAQELDPGNIKAMYRRGIALTKLGCFTDAVHILREAQAFVSPICCLTMMIET